MKNILYTIILSFLFSFSVFGEVYYCAMEKVTGFESAFSREVTRFNPKRFTIEIKNGQATSESLHFSPYLSNPCVKLWDAIHCANKGKSRQFYLHYPSMIFTLTAPTVMITDSIFLAIGKCENFE